MLQSVDNRLYVARLKAIAYVTCHGNIRQCFCQVIRSNLQRGNRKYEARIGRLYQVQASNHQTLNALQIHRDTFVKQDATPECLLRLSLIVNQTAHSLKALSY